MLTTVLLVSVVMIDVERIGSRAALITSFTALGKGWSDMRASMPPERSPQTDMIHIQLNCCIMI